MKLSTAAPLKIDWALNSLKSAEFSAHDDVKPSSLHFWGQNQVSSKDWFEPVGASGWPAGAKLARAHSAPNSSVAELIRAQADMIRAPRGRREPSASAALARGALTTQGDGGWHSLPPELTEKIFHGLDARSLARIASTCREFRQLSEAHPCWNFLAAGSTVGSMSAVGACLRGLDVYRRRQIVSSWEFSPPTESLAATLNALKAAEDAKERAMWAQLAEPSPELREFILRTMLEPSRPRRR